MNKKTRINKKIIRIIAIPSGLILALFIAFNIYAGSYYRADDTAVNMLDTSYENVTITQANGNLIFMPDNPKAGLIFYPGALVEDKSYVPLMIELSKQDIACVLVHMPYNMAIFGINKADNVLTDYPMINDWYIAGHSLGGAMAAVYTADHASTVDGLILLAAYSTKDLSDTNLEILSIYGSNDGVLKIDTYNSSKANLPSDYEEVVINGGNHAGFGDYGAQKGDGPSSITNDEQVTITANAIHKFIFN